MIKKKNNNKQAMKGLLYKDHNGQWMVRAITAVPIIGPVTTYELKLHPDDVLQINEDDRIFDNIEARIAAYPNVEFEVQTIATGNSEWDVVDEDVAKLII